LQLLVAEVITAYLQSGRREWIPFRSTKYLQLFFSNNMCFFSSHETIYSIHVPWKVRPGFNVVATIEIIRSQSPIEVTVNFMSSDDEINFSRTDTIDPRKIA